MNSEHIVNRVVFTMWILYNWLEVKITPAENPFINCSNVHCRPLSLFRCFWFEMPVRRDQTHDWDIENTITYNIFPTTAVQTIPGWIENVNTDAYCCPRQYKTNVLHTLDTAQWWNNSFSRYTQFKSSIGSYCVVAIIFLIYCGAQWLDQLQQYPSIMWVYAKDPNLLRIIFQMHNNRPDHHFHGKTKVDIHNRM